MLLPKNTLRGFHIVSAVICLADLAMLWMLIPSIPGSLSMLALPLWALRCLHSLAFSLAALQSLAVPLNLFFWYHLIFVLIPLACLAGLWQRKDLARKILIIIACLNACYWLVLMVRALFRVSLWQACLGYGPALIICILYIIYFNDRELKGLFKD